MVLAGWSGPYPRSGVDWAEAGRYLLGKHSQCWMPPGSHPSGPERRAPDRRLPLLQVHHPAVAAVPPDPETDEPAPDAMSWLGQIYKRHYGAMLVDYIRKLFLQFANPLHRETRPKIRSKSTLRSRSRSRTSEMESDRSRVGLAPCTLR